jgi:hypothetical protein
MLVLVSSFPVCGYEIRMCNLTEVRRQKENACLGVSLINCLPFTHDYYLLSIMRPRKEVPCLARITHGRSSQFLPTAPFPSHPAWPVASSPKPVLLTTFNTWLSIFLRKDDVNDWKVLEGSTLVTATSARRRWARSRWMGLLSVALVYVPTY